MFKKNTCFTVTLTVNILPKLQKKILYNVVASNEIDAVGIAKEAFMREGEYIEETISNISIDNNKEVYMIC